MTTLHARAETRNNIYPISTFKDRDNWIKLILATDGDELSQGARNVGIRIAFHHNVETGQCNPKLALLAAGTGMSERNVRRMLRELEDTGWLGTDQSHGRRSHHFELRVPNLAEETIEETIEETEINPDNTVRDDIANPDTVVRDDDGPTRTTLSAQPGQSRYANPDTVVRQKRESKSEEKSERKKDSLQPRLDLEEDRRREVMVTPQAKSPLVWEQEGSSIKCGGVEYPAPKAVTADGTYLTSIRTGMSDGKFKGYSVGFLTTEFEDGWPSDIWDAPDLEAVKALAQDHADGGRREMVPASPPESNNTEDGFAEFYRQYPKHADKADALKAYRAVIKKKLATPEALLAAAMRYAAERVGQDPKFTKNPATWLNKQSWLNEPEKPIGTTIDADGNPIAPPPNYQSQRTGQNSWMDIAMAGLNRGQS